MMPYSAKVTFLDGGLVELGMLNDGDESDRMILDANGVSAFIHQLSAMRANMQPPIAAAPADGLHQGPVDPAWRMSVDLQTGSKTLLLRHSGAGWVAFHFSKSESAKLGMALHGEGLLQPSVPDNSHPH